MWQLPEGLTGSTRRPGGFRTKVKRFRVVRSEGIPRSAGIQSDIVFGNCYNLSLCSHVSVKLKYGSHQVPTDDQPP